MPNFLRSRRNGMGKGTPVEHPGREPGSTGQGGLRSEVRGRRSEVGGLRSEGGRQGLRPIEVEGPGTLFP